MSLFCYLSKQNSMNAALRIIYFYPQFCWWRLIILRSSVLSKPTTIKHILKSFNTKLPFLWKYVNILRQRTYSESWKLPQGRETIQTTYLIYLATKKNEYVSQQKYIIHLFLIPRSKCRTWAITARSKNGVLTFSDIHLNKLVYFFLTNVFDVKVI